MLRLCYDMSAISLEYLDDLDANLQGYDTFTGDRDASLRMHKCGRKSNNCGDIEQRSAWMGTTGLQGYRHLVEVHYTNVFNVFTWVFFKPRVSTRKLLRLLCEKGVLRRICVVLTQPNENRS